MKKYFALFLVLLIQSGLAFAANWMSINDKWDIDLDSIKWEDNNRIIEVWLRTDVLEDNENFNNKKIKYIYYNEYFYPSAKLFLTLNQITYDENGKTLERIKFPYNGEVSSIPPSSSYEYINDLFLTLTPTTLEEYKQINQKYPNVFPFGTSFKKPDEDIKNFYPLKVLKDFLISDNQHKYKESDYINAYCTGAIEYVLPNSHTRVDCLTEKYAIEFEFAPKWKEAIGQALYYAKITDRKPAVAVIMTKPTDEMYINRIIEVDKNISIFRIRAFK